jgi:hypothetical protein
MSEKIPNLSRFINVLLKVNSISNIFIVGGKKVFFKITSGLFDIPEAYWFFEV